MGVTNYIWDVLSDNVLMEKDDEGETIASYVQKPELHGEAISQTRDGQTRYYNFDGEGNTCELTDENENVTDTFEYSAFGKEIARTGTTENPFGYKGALGYYTNGETNDIYVRARTYEPTIGRWCSMDPIGFFDGVNRYTYVLNNPILLADPSGLICIVCSTKRWSSGTFAALDGEFNMGTPVQDAADKIVFQAIAKFGLTPSAGHKTFDKIVRQSPRFQVDDKVYAKDFVRLLSRPFAVTFDICSPDKAFDCEVVVTELESKVNWNGTSWKLTHNHKKTKDEAFGLDDLENVFLAELKNPTDQKCKWRIVVLDIPSSLFVQGNIGTGPNAPQQDIHYREVSQKIIVKDSIKQRARSDQGFLIGWQGNGTSGFYDVWDFITAKKEQSHGSSDECC